LSSAGRAEQCDWRGQLCDECCGGGGGHRRSLQLRSAAAALRLLQGRGLLPRGHCGELRSRNTELRLLAVGPLLMLVPPFMRSLSRFLKTSAVFMECSSRGFCASASVLDSAWSRLSHSSPVENLNGSFSRASCGLEWQTVFHCLANTDCSRVQGNSSDGQVQASQTLSCQSVSSTFTESSAALQSCP
jgi:hypothetical protein